MQVRTRTYYLLVVGMLFLYSFLFSCRKRFEVYSSEGDFRVSADTVFLDSVFAGISSPTYSFKIYNTSDKTISLEAVYLEKRNQSPYRLNVDGVAGREFENVIIPPEDSIYVFVELTADTAGWTDPVYEEKLWIEDAASAESVLLTAFVKDAYFLYPQRFPDRSVDSIQVGEYDDGRPVKVPGFMLPGDTTWTSEKPIVVYGHVGVPPGHTLHITEGTHVYFHFNSGIVVYENARLLVEGSLENPVILEDDRMQPEYENAPGMWNFIWLKSGSTGNLIRHAVIKNAVAGVIAHPVDTTGEKMLDIQNTRIFNMSAYGIIAIASRVEGYNVVTNNTGASALAMLLGGKYDFVHCTFANYSRAVRPLTSAAVLLTNEYRTVDADGNETVYVNDLVGCRLANNIIYGNNDVEFYAVRNEAAAFTFNLHNSLVKFYDPYHQIDADYLDFDNPEFFRDNVLNGDPDFENPDENRLRIGPRSAAIGIADPQIAAEVPLDITGMDRTAAPDAGSYQHSEED